MRKVLLIALLSAMSLSAQAEYNGQPVDKSLAELDKLTSCKTAQQIDTANRVLNYMFAFKWWHIKNMVDALHPQYVHWHGSRVFHAVITPEDQRANLPYKDGMVTRDEYLQDLAMVAYTNEVSKYIVDLNRLECVGDDTVVLSSMFNGVSVFRDKDGYVTHKVQLTNIPVRFTTMLKDGLVYRFIVDLPDSATVDMFKRIKEEIAKTPPLPKDEATKTTYQEILSRFKTEAGEAP
jgi:hypothetical protein